MPVVGEGQLPPPLMSEPRQLHGFVDSSAPQGSPGTSALHVPGTRPATEP
jgi:hypothetical protein